MKLKEVTSSISIQNISIRNILGAYFTANGTFCRNGFHSINIICKHVSTFFTC
jgi:hypothetical protein